MFSTFLNPFFAAGATAMVLGFPAIASQVFGATMGLRDTGVGTWSYRPQFFFQLTRKSFLGS